MVGQKHWFITGISSGIGAALAKAVLERGDRVTGTARSAEARAQFEGLAPGRAHGILLDMADQAGLEAAAASAWREAPVDVLVNNAGQSLFGAFEEVSAEETRKLFEVNVFGPWTLTRAMLPLMRERGTGTVVQLSSGCGLYGLAGLSAYCASKFALEGFSEALAQEVAGFGLKVMIVEPGAVATRFISHGTKEATQRLDSYGFVSGQGKSILDAYYETGAVSPESVARDILAALDGPEVPLRLLLGTDNKGGVLAKLNAIKALAEG